MCKVIICANQKGGVDEYYNGDSVYYKASMGLRKNCGFKIRCKDIKYLHDDAYD